RCHGDRLAVRRHPVRDGSRRAVHRRLRGRSGFCTSCRAGPEGGRRPARTVVCSKLAVMATPRVAVLTREYPPDVYGGAGTAVEYLVRELRRLAEVSVHCWGAPRDEPGGVRYQPWAAVSGRNPEAAALEAMSINLAMAAGVKGAGIVHSHTWYANFGGHLAKLT